MNMPSWMCQGANTTEQKIVQGRSQLITGHSFYGSLAMGLHIVPDATGAVEKIQVDEESITYNESYIDTLTEPEMQGALAMAVNPLALQHNTRRGGRDEATWQKASEAVSNPALIAAGFTLPPGANKDTTFAGKSAEEAYQILYVKQQLVTTPLDQGASVFAHRQLL